MKVKQPTLLIDEKKCKANICKMLEKAKLHNIEFRPHFKTHQSLEIGRWFKENGVIKITVSSLTMAEYFATDWKDITVAFPVNINEIELINSLASKIRLNLCIENIESSTYLATNLKNSVNVYLKIDVGYHRTGINPERIDFINSILDVVKSSEKLNFVGFLGHSGHTYKSNSKSEIHAIHKESLSTMKKLRNHYKAKYPNLKVSLGDTPSCSIVNNFEGVNEIRPGNFVFYDLTQHKIGSNKIAQIAIAMACPVVAIHYDRLEIVIYGGGVHFSKDFLETENGIAYGKVVENKNHLWGNVIDGMYLKSLSQEHGIISVPKARINQYKVGDYITILPVHSCMTANLMKEYRNQNKIIQRL